MMRSSAPSTAALRRVEVVDRLEPDQRRRRSPDDRDHRVDGDAGGDDPSTPRTAVAQTDGGQAPSPRWMATTVSAPRNQSSEPRAAMFIATSAHDALSDLVVSAGRCASTSRRRTRRRRVQRATASRRARRRASAAPPATTGGQAAANQVTTPTETATSTASTTGEPVGDAPANAASTPDATAMSASDQFVVRSAVESQVT